MAEDSPVTSRRQQGTSRAYILDRLKRENRTDFIDAIERGELSAHSAAIEMGWVKRPPSVAAVTHQARKRKLRLEAITGAGLSAGQMMELWLGPNPSQGSLFSSREELEAAWTAHRDELMARHGSHGRRPMIWWELAAGDLEHPGYATERSVLWRAGVLAADERTTLEREWRQEFQTAQAPDFTLDDGNGDLLKGDCARAAYYEHHDIPRELVKRWEKAERRRRGRQPVAPSAPQEEAAAAK